MALRFDHVSFADVNKTEDYYNRFYGQGGWKYDLEKARRLLKKMICDPAGWARGSRVLELGCGMGQHAHLLHRLGLDVTAVDLSVAGIGHAKRSYPGPKYEQADVTEWTPQPSGFDGILVRGLSIYHYELSGTNKHGHDVPGLTGRFFNWLRPGGSFVLQIVTDFSGATPRDAVHSSKLSSYKRLFAPHGNIYRITDFDGMPLTNDEQAASVKREGIIIFTRKP